MAIAGKYCIAGVGHTAYGKLPGRSAESLTVEAIHNALLDSGISKGEIDCVLTKAPTSAFQMLYSTRIAECIGVVPKVTATIDNAGASTATAIVYAAMCIEEGLCSAAVVSYGDNPLTGSRSVYSEFGDGDSAPYGLFGAAGHYGLIAQRYLHEFGKSAEDFAVVPISDRAWALKNPNAFFRKPLSLADYLAARWVVEPFRLFDCCPITDGAAAVVVVPSARANDAAKKPVYIAGFGQGHSAAQLTSRKTLTVSGAVQSGKTAFTMAGITPGEVDFVQLYDPFSVVPAITLEDYGFCSKGEGLDFLADGKTGPHGALPMNTSGGLLSETGMPGMQLIVEAVRQLRGECGDRQVDGAEVGVVSNQGGYMTTHATLVLTNAGN
jgi:acetyl-CoA acetyltransferase